MQLLGANQKVKQSGMLNTAEFSIKVTAKSFGVLINGLYANKIRAVIRELSTNAYEAHQLLKKEHVPFLVKLPSRYDNNFSIRDYGPGLSEDDILGKQVKKRVINEEDGVEEEITVRSGGLYTTLFDSTKDNSNEFGGAFGLGSKSPFAYCDNFIVVSIHNGLKNTYFCNKDQEGIPSCSLAHSESTTEPSGIEIKIAVNKNDEWRFVEEAKAVYQFFKTRPIITGQSISYDTETVLLSGPDWEVTSGSQSYAIMGNIPYDLKGYTGDHKDILAINGLRFYFKIGEIEPQPSREGLSFTKNTQLSIQNKLKLIKESLEKAAEKEISSCTCWWDAYIKYQPIKAKYKFINLDFNKRSLDKEYEEKIDEEYIDMNGKKCTRKVSKELRYQYSYGKDISTIRYVEPCERRHFVIEDSCSYLRKRIKDYLSSKNGEAFLIPENEIDEYARILGVPKTRFVKASDLPKPSIAAKASNRHKTKVMQYNGNAYGSATNFWTDVDIDLENDSGYYIPIFNNRILFEAVEHEPSKLKTLQAFLKLKGEIYGVKKAYIDKVKSPTMINLEDELKKFFQTNSALIQKLKIGSEHYSEIRYHHLVKILKLSKGFAKFFGTLYNEIEELEKLSDEYSKNSNLINTFYQWGQTTQLAPTVAGANNVKAKLELYNKEYPLLGRLNHNNLTTGDAAEIIAYLSGKEAAAKSNKGNP